MSKLFKKYEELKKEHPEKLYLLKSGIFYISLQEDAEKLSELFSFKITNLNDTIIKCGFPETKLEFYTKLLTTCSVDFEIIDSAQIQVSNKSDYLNNQKVQAALKSIKNLDMNTISFQKAFEILRNLNETMKYLDLPENDE